MSRFGSIGTQYFDDAGDPLISGLIHFYEPNSDTRKATYADVSLSIANTNPVILSAAGRQPNIFFSGSARAVLTDSDDVQIEVRDPVGGDATEGAFSDWNADTSYSVPDIVVGSDGSFYISITDGNEGNDPTSDTVNWSKIRSIRVWNTNDTYELSAIVQGSDGLLYSSQVGSNTGNDPTSDAVNWGSAAGGSGSAGLAVVNAAGKTYAYNNF